MGNSRISKQNIFCQKARSVVDLAFSFPNDTVVVAIKIFVLAVRYWLNIIESVSLYHYH